MSENFYRAFEDRYRGSSELILGRLAAYREVLERISKAYPGGEILDIGCGRGEWLAYANQYGFTTHGVDLDAGMLVACQLAGLNASLGDGIETLRALKSESQVVVSAFHVVEHISFDVLRDLVCEAFRVLKPGGILIMETPNPENIIVGSRNFYLDPTHVRPIPPLLLSFIPEFYGFGVVKIFRLQEDQSILGKGDISLLDVLEGVSPDYSVVSQKSISSTDLGYLDISNIDVPGVTLEMLAGEYKRECILRQSQVLTQIENLKSGVSSQLDSLHASVNGLIDSQKNATLAIEELSRCIEVMKTSWSWRITRPLRWLKALFFENKR